MPSPFFDGLGEACLDAFGERASAIFQSHLEGSQPVNLEVIFNARYQEVDYKGIEYGAPHPVAWHRTGLILAKYDDTLKIKQADGSYITYRINQIGADGLELTQLGLTAP